MSHTNSMCFLVNHEQEVPQIVIMYCMYQRLALLIEQKKIVL